MKKDLIALMNSNAGEKSSAQHLDFKIDWIGGYGT